MSPLALAVSNLTRRRVPTLIALVAITLAVALGGTLLRLYVLTSERFDTLAEGEAVIGAKSGEIAILLGSLNLEGPPPGPLPLALFETLRDRGNQRLTMEQDSVVPFLRAVVPMVHFATWRGHRVIGTDEAFRLRPDGSARALDGRWPARHGEVVLGAEVARRHGLAPGDRLTAEAWTDEPRDAVVRAPLQVVGVLGPTGSAFDGALYTGVAQAHQVLGRTSLAEHPPWRGDVVHYILAYLEPGGFEQLADLIDKRTVAQVIEVEAARAQLEALTGAGRRIGSLIAALVVGLGGLCMAAMMVTRFDAMTAQLAVLRALGYRKGEVAGWLLWEGVLLGAAACLLGAGLDALGMPWVQSLLGAALPDRPVALLRSAPVWIAALLATVLAVFIPLLRLYRQDVHAALRGL